MHGILALWKILTLTNNQDWILKQTYPVYLIIQLEFLRFFRFFFRFELNFFSSIQFSYSGWIQFIEYNNKWTPIALH